MSEIFSLSKYCREAEIDVNSLVKICKRSGIFVYTVGTSYYSVWADLVKKFVPSDAVQEFNRHQNKTSFPLDNCLSVNCLLLVI